MTCGAQLHSLGTADAEAWQSTLNTQVVPFLRVVFPRLCVRRGPPPEASLASSHRGESIPRSLPQGRGRHAGEGLSTMAQRPVPYPVSSRARVPRHTRNVRSTEFANEPCHHFPHGADDTLSYVRRGGYRGRAAR